VIADTPHERMLLQQMLVDACATDEMLDVGALCFRHNRNTENGSENVTGEIED